MIVSVLMLTYNHERYIEQAINSVMMQQTDFDYELVIGEDCSTDNTRKIILNIYKNCPEKIKLIISDHNVGVHQNLARTLAACQGKYIAYLDGDDYWTSPNKLHKQVNILDESVSEIFLELRTGFDLCGDDHHADQRACGVCFGKDAVLGFHDARDRRVPDLPDPRHPAVPAAVQDVRSVWRLDRNSAYQPMVCAADRVSDTDRAVLHLDHDRLFRVDP